MWQSGGVLFLALKMSQNPLESLPRFIGYDVQILNASDDFDGSTAATTKFNIDIEYSFESLDPGHRSVMLES